MGNITKSALLEFVDTFDDMDAELEAAAKADRERASRNKKPRPWGVYDENGKLVSKVDTKSEAIATRAEWRRMDAEEGRRKGKYTIGRVDDLKGDDL